MKTYVSNSIINNRCMICGENLINKNVSDSVIDNFFSISSR
jgi:hypothetical protein